MSLRFQLRFQLKFQLELLRKRWQNQIEAWMRLEKLNDTLGLRHFCSPLISDQGAGHYSGMANGQAGSGITLNTNPLVTLTHDCILAKLTYDRTLVTPTYYQLDAPEAKCLYAKYFEELVKQCNFKCKLTSFKLSNLRPHMEGRMYVINVTPLAGWSHKHIIDSMWPMTECLQ